MSDSRDLMDCSLPGSSVQGFSRQEYWSGLPLPYPGDLPDPGIEPRSPALPASSLWIELQGKLLILDITFCFLSWLTFYNMVFVLAAVGLCFFLLFWWMRLRGLYKLPQGREWQWENWVLLSWAGPSLLSKALIQSSADGWGCTPSPVVVWPSLGVYRLYGRVNGELQEGLH